jgi:HSP20 family protein
MSTLVRWAPRMELDATERLLQRLFNTVGSAPGPLPATDVYETADEIVVEVEVPGYEERELTVEVTDHVLAIKGRRTTTDEEKGKEFRLHERLEHEFERRFALPTSADTSGLKATFGKGILEVRTPKAKDAGTTQVPIAKA